MSHTLTVTEAKATLGDLIAEAMQGKEVFIRSARGESAFVQLVRVSLPDPIPHIPPGGLDLSEAQLRLHETFPVEDDEIFAR